MHICACAESSPRVDWAVCQLTSVVEFAIIEEIEGSDDKAKGEEYDDDEEAFYINAMLPRCLFSGPQQFNETIKSGHSRYQLKVGLQRMHS